MDPDVFDVNSQANFIKNMGNHVADEARKFAMDADETALDPLKVVDTVKASMSEANVSQEYIDSLDFLKQDQDVIDAIKVFQDALDGKENVHKIADMVPQAKNSGENTFVAFRDDPGMNGAVLKGELSAQGESDIVRYSNYISGAGTSVGGALTDLPSTISDMANGITNVSLYKYTKLEDKLSKTGDEIAKLVESNDAIVRQYGFDPENAMRQRKGYVVDMSGLTKDAAKKEVRISYETTQQKLRREFSITENQMKMEQIKKKGKLKAQKMLGKVGRGVQGATAGFSIATGGVDIKAGDEMIQSAKVRYDRNEMSEEDYDKVLRDGRLRMAQGTFAIGDGINNIRQIIMDKVGDRVKDLSKGARMGLRFASVVGGAMSIGMGITSVTKNAIAADEANKSGNVGRAAMYGVMAALDCVSVVLDGVSMVLDCIPGIGQAISFVVDLVNTIVGLVNMVIGFFADMVDTRTPTQKLQGALNDHINSPEFQKYLSNMADMYKKEGYDLFTYMVDAKAMGLEEDGVEGTTVTNDVVRKLSQKALDDSKDPNLRVVIADRTLKLSGNTLEGRNNDDKILGGYGTDTIYGHGGDDVLFGEAHNDTIFGGEGNDYLNGGASHDKLLGEAGDDILNYEPGIDILADGGEGVDILEVAGHFFAYSSQQNSKALVLPPNLREYVYVDLTSQGNKDVGGHGGIALGALLSNIDMLNNRMHKPAFGRSDALATAVKSRFTGGNAPTTVNEGDLAGRYLWYLCEDGTNDFVTDGRYLYSRAISGDHTLQISSFDMNDISADEAKFDDDNKFMLYKTDLLSSIFAFAYRTESKVLFMEKVSAARVPDKMDVKLQVIADDSVKMIDVGYGANSYVYTGNSDTMITFTMSNSPYREIYKFISGGSGNNPLVINGSPRAVPRTHGYSLTRNQCIFLDCDIDLENANSSPNIANTYAWDYQNNKVDRGIFIKNINTIYLSNQSNAENSYWVDATNVSATKVPNSNVSRGIQFILENHAPSTKFVGTQGDDSLMLKHIEGNMNQIDGYEGRNFLSVEYYGIPSHYITLDITENNRWGKIHGVSNSLFVGLRNIQNVQGNARTTLLNGHKSENNLLIANGGACVVNAMGADNTLVAKRGAHTLSGAEGIDVYELHGPFISEFLVVTVTKDKTGGIKAAATGGTWSFPALNINVLDHDGADVVLDRLEFIDGEGNVTAQKGRVRMSRNKRTIIYEPANAFGNLEPGKSESLRIRYNTKGSRAVLNESHPGNRLKLHGFTEASHIDFTIASNGDLQCISSAATRDIIFEDKRWGDLHREGETNLDTLMVDFATRFSVIQFKTVVNSEQVPVTKELSKMEIYEFLKAKLGGLKTVCSRFDSFIDASTVTGNIVDAQGGDNVVLCKRRKVAYRSGNGDNIFDLTKLGAGDDGSNPVTSIHTGAGDDVVIFKSDVQSLQVHFLAAGATQKQGRKSIVINGMNPNQLGVADSSGDWKWTLSKSGTTMAMLDTIPELIMFVSGEERILIDDVRSFFDTRILGGNHFYRRVYDSAYMQMLHASDIGKPYDFFFRISVTQQGLNLDLFHDTTHLYSLQVGYIPPVSIDAVFICGMFHLALRRGIQMKDELLDAFPMRFHIMECLRSPQKHTVSGVQNFSNIVYASKFSSPYHVPDGDALIYADYPSCEVYGGVGNNIIKVTASNVTVGTGPLHRDGFDVVQIPVSLRDISAKLYSPHSYSGGKSYVIIEGATRSEVTFTDSVGNPLLKGSSSSTAWTLKVSNQIVATFDQYPTFMLFRGSDEYEVIYYPQCLMEKGWDTEFRTYISRGLRVYNADDIASTDLRLKTGPRWGTISFATAAVPEVDTFWLNYFSIDNMSISDLAMVVGSYMPGGIRFSDRVVGDSELLSFLENVIQKSTNEIEGTLREGAAQYSFEHHIEGSIYNKFVEVVRKWSYGMSVTNVDTVEEITRYETELESNTPMIITNAQYPEPPEPSEHYLLPEKKIAVTWKGITYYVFENNSPGIYVDLVAYKVAEKRYLEYRFNYCKGLKGVRKDRGNREITWTFENTQSGTSPEWTMSWDLLWRESLFLYY